MKQLLMVLVFTLIGVIGAGRTQAIEFNFMIPNAEPITMCYDNTEHKWFNAITSRILTIGDFEGRIGGISGTFISAMTYNVQNLEKLSLFGHKIAVDSVIKDTPIIVGIYGSKDFNSNKWSWGEMVISLQIGLK